MNNASNVWNNTELHSSLRTLKIPLWQDKPRRGGSRKSVQYLSSYMAWFGCSRVFTISTTNIYLQWTLLTLEFVIWCIQHEFHETCHSVTFNSWKKRLQTMLWRHNTRVNSHQRWKHTRFRVGFHLWCELTSTMNVTEWQVSWN